MTDDLTLYQTDRPAWIAKHAPNMAAILSQSTDAQLAESWERMPRDYQTATWQHLGDADRERVRMMRNK